VRTTLAGYEQGRPSEPLTPEDVVAARFTPTVWREGYDQGQVDDFLDEVVVALRRLIARDPPQVHIDVLDVTYQVLESL